MTTTLAMETRAAAEAPEDPLAEMIRAARAGDREALSALIEAVERKVYTLAYRLVGLGAGAEDVSQEVLLQICSKLGQFREGGNFWGWVYRIVVNKAHDYRRARDPQAVEILDLAAPVDYHPARQEQLRRVMEAMGELTEKERAALVLTDGLTSQEAARVLGCLAISVRTRAAHARAKLRRVLARFYPELREDA